MKFLEASFIIGFKVEGDILAPGSFDLQREFHLASDIQVLNMSFSGKITSLSVNTLRFLLSF